MRKYRVVLAIEVDGVAHKYGDVVELELEVAALYAHALIAIEEGEGHGGND
jgi:hypothetical protein